MAAASKAKTVVTVDTTAPNLTIAMTDPTAAITFTIDADEQLTAPPSWEQVPWRDEADTKLTPAGRVSVRATLPAAPGPLLVTVTV